VRNAFHTNGKSILLKNYDSKKFIYILENENINVILRQLQDDKNSFHKNYTVISVLFTCTRIFPDAIV